MKTNITTLLIIFILLPSIKTNAQDEPTMSGVIRQYQSTLLAFQKIKRLLKDEKKDNSIDFESIKGSPYLNEKFSLGKLYIYDSLIDNNLFRYNIYSDEIEVTENNQLYGLYKVKGMKLMLDNQTLVLKNYQENSKSKNKSYFIVLSEGKNISLYKRKKCKLTPAQKATTPNQMDRAAKFNIYEDYYIKKENDEHLYKISTKERNILKIMQDKKEIVKNYIDKHNINLKNEKKLTELFTFYNSL
ncbi:hypothetical protein [Aquimarina sp. 2201CG14-23]|uniref:hypothetical protein n=1 Tax=Aquimarina mycalae TaxID=3040073 RepID=UPI002477F64F|nr:hypothetical protein [Aquimarina sp. 2201CG14-23]MDH7444779.1 hypothetical protein [Aquimarina sp. 2201CG14-23]